MNRLNFWCLFEKKCGEKCIFNLLPVTDYHAEKEILKGFEKQCTYNFCEEETPNEFRSLAEQEILAIKQMNLYLIRKKIQWNGINIDIPPILEKKIQEIKRNKKLITALSCYDGPKKIINSLIKIKA